MILRPFGEKVFSPRALDEKINDITVQIENIPGKERFHRVEILIDGTDPLLWVTRQLFDTKFYLRDREAPCNEIAGCGRLLAVNGSNGDDRKQLFKNIRKYIELLPDGCRFYGGVSFYEKIRDERWKSFGTMHFYVPEIEIITDESGSRLIFNIDKSKYNKKELFALFKKIDFKNGELTTKLPAIENETEFPESREWKNSVKKYLQKIEEEEIDKIVAARCVKQVFKNNIDKFLLIENLRRHSEKCSLFMFVFNGKTHFLGSTPEILFKREGLNVYTEAVAGTRPVSSENAKTDYFEKELMSSAKDIREQNAVEHYIVEKLAGSCSKIKMSEKRSLKLFTLQHICTGIECKIRESVTDGDLVLALMPTPAVSGKPVGKAMKILGENESFDRGWYSGTVGYLGKEKTVLHVAIRSALSELNELTLYAGAGIVEGSVPKKEWDETEIKMSKFKRITGNEY